MTLTILLFEKNTKNSYSHLWHTECMKLIQKPRGTRVIDDIMIVGGIIGPLSAIPQIIAI